MKGYLSQILSETPKVYPLRFVSDFFQGCSRDAEVWFIVREK
jgi:hypothetical protein